MGDVRPYCTVCTPMAQYVVVLFTVVIRHTKQQAFKYGVCGEVPPYPISTPLSPYEVVPKFRLCQGMR